jgi:hypothetical protein
MEKCKNSPSHWFQAVVLTDGRTVMVCTHCGEQGAILPAFPQEWPVFPVPIYPLAPTPYCPLPGVYPIPSYPLPYTPVTPWMPVSPWYPPVITNGGDTSNMILIQ